MPRFLSVASESEDLVESDASEPNELSIRGSIETRREFIKQIAGTSVAIAVGPNLLTSDSVDQIVATGTPAAASGSVKVNLKTVVRPLWS